MLIKLLFTALVIITVILVFRARKQAPAAPVGDEPQPRSPSPRVVAYALVGVLVLISAAVFVFRHQADNRVVHIRVITADGDATLYQARQRDIRGRRFVTVDGVQVALGESDRMEMQE